MDLSVETLTASQKEILQQVNAFCSYLLAKVNIKVE